MDLEQQVHNDILKPTLKLAYPKTSRLKVIVVRDDLQNQTAEYLESLVYHELGHCVLGRPHDENERIMSSSGVEALTGFRYFYLKELFTHHPVVLNILFGVTKIDNSLELVYQVDYVAFNQRIFHQLFYNHQLNQYFDNENPDLR